MYDFYSIYQAQRYLVGGIIRYGAAPVYVMNVFESVDGGIKVTYCLSHEINRDSRIEHTVDIDDSQLNFKPIPLGYVNKRSKQITAASIARIPARMWKVGACEENIRIYSNTNYVRWRKGQVLYSPELYETVNNIYPSFEEAIELASSDDNELVAFSRKFAIDEEGKVFTQFRKNPIGSWSKDGIVLKENRKYFKQMVEKAGVLCT